jgi:glutamate-1-semialdehyde 2,1-aminomutase
MSNVEKLKKDIIDTYEKKTRKSFVYYQKAQKFIPAGDTRTINWFQPYPFYGDHAEGYCIYDYDGNRYVDLCNNMTAMIHGHSHPHVVEALKKQVARGTTLGIPSDAQYKLAELICNRVPSVDKIRFTNTGSEADMIAMRLARAFTGKDIIVKIDGGYHGCSDYAQVNELPNFFTNPPELFLASKGVPARIMEDVRVVDYNDLAALEKVLEEEKGKVAAFILEPVLGVGGGCAPHEGYLQGVREITKRHGVLLIFDEVITFRLSEGGMQKKVGVKPDITAFGKLIGGGLAIGAIGCSEEVMALMDPRTMGNVSNSGTFTGNVLTMTAGLANVEILTQKEIDRIDALGDRLAKAINKMAVSIGIDVSAYSIGSMLAVFPTKQGTPLNNSREVYQQVGPVVEFSHYFFLDMLSRGVTFLQRGLLVISTPMDEKLIDEVSVKIGESFEYLKPLRESLG